MKFDKCFILIIFLMLILSVSAVNAADDFNISDNSINSREAISPASPTVNKIWTVDDFLNNYTTIQDNDVVLIRNGTGTPSGNVVLSQNGITIFTEGGVIFDGQGKNMHFEIKGNNVLIKGITFKNFNYTSNGGAMLWAGTNGTLTNCTFINNAAGYGGAVYWTGTNGTLTNCTFINNAAGYGGAVYWTGTNGVLTGCTFTSNAAGYGGAVYWTGTNGVLTGCTFTNNSANRDGGYNFGGGAVYWTGTNGVLTGCTFTSNAAEYLGGAVYWYGTNGVLTGCTFSNNAAYYGGAVYWRGSVYSDGANGHLTDCNFTNNTSSDNGGAVCWGGANGHLTGCTFTNNSANRDWGSDSGSGAVYWYGYDGVLTGCTFINNTAYYCDAVYGGAFYWYGANGHLTDCTFINNHGTVYLRGYVHWYGANGTLTGCTFINNPVAIRWEGANGTLTGCIFTNNTNDAVMWKGANGHLTDCNFTNNPIAVDWGGDNGVLTGCIFINNPVAVGWGGDNGVLTGCIFINNPVAVQWIGDKGHLTGCTFINNSAWHCAVEWIGSNGHLTGCTFINNTAKDGGAVKWSGANGHLTGCTFINNTVGNGGGAVYWGSVGSMVNCSFVNSKSVHYNGIYAQNDLTINGGNGIVYIVTSGKLSGISIIVLNNKTCRVYPNQRINIIGKIVSGNLTIVDNTTDVFKFYFNGVKSSDKPKISNNGEYFIPYTATNVTAVNVGANYSHAGKDSKYKNGILILKENSGSSTNVNKNWTVNEFLNKYNTIQDNDVVFIRNGIGTPNGNVVLNQNGITIFTEGNVVFDGRNCNGHFEITGSNVLIKGITFKNFNFTGGGGAVYWTGDNGTLVDSTFINNTANVYVYDGDFNDNVIGYGGAVYWDGSNGHLTGCTFTGNAAAFGGAVYWDDDNGALNNSTFINNTADSYGGAVGWDGDNGTLVDSTFINNTAYVNFGGAVGWYGDNGALNNSTFINNTAAFGGAVCLHGDNSSLTDCNFIINSAYFEGGAVQLEGDNGALTGCTFTGNTAESGGAIKVLDCTIINCNFNNTKSSKDPNQNGIDAGNLVIKGGSGIVNINADTVSGVHTIVLNNGNEDVPVNHAIDVTGKIVTDTGSLTLVDSVNRLSFNIGGDNYAGNQVSIREDGAYVTSYIPTTAGVTIPVSATYNKTNSSAGNKNGALHTIKDNTTMSVTVSNITYGGDATVTVTLDSKATGSVTIKVNGKDYGSATIKNGKATKTISGLAASSYEVTASYNGDNNFAQDTANARFTVSKISPGMIVSVGNVGYGDNVTVIVSLNYKATGSVTITADGKTKVVNIVDGRAEWILSGLATRSYAVTVSYGGDKNFTEDTANTEFIVSKISPDMSVSVGNVNFGDNATVTVTLNPKATGTVTITVDGKTKVVNIIDGKAEWKLTGLDVGLYAVTVTYGGDNNFTEDTVNVRFNVVSGYILEAGDVVKFFRNGTQYHAYLKDTKGNPVAGEKIIVTFVPSRGGNPSQYTIITNANGIATLAINANPGTYNIIATYDNQSVSSKITVLKLDYLISAEDIVMGFKDGTQYTVKVVDTQGNPVAGVKVSLTIGSSKWSKNANYNIVTDKNGVARLSLGLAIGQYTFTAKYSNKVVTTKVTVLSGSYRLITSDVVKYFKNGTQYTVKVTNMKGNPIAGQKVVVDLYSRTGSKMASYTLTTNNNGIATLAINLNPNQYTIKASIGSDSVKNTITILPTLTAETLTKPANQPGNLVAKLVNGQGKPLSGKSITFTIKSKTYTKTTNANGLASLPIGLGVGTWTINIADPATGVKTTAKVIITKAKN